MENPSARHTNWDTTYCGFVRSDRVGIDLPGIGFTDAAGGDIEV